ncbi:MAG: diaminopimelate epimerase [Bacteroidota bacterium]
MHFLFTKMTGAGNDFIVIDDRKERISNPPKLVIKLCDRRWGIGADGLILIRKSKRAAYEMMYYNADGSYGGMCGNGGRCIAHFTIANRIAGKKHFFEALGYLYEAKKLSGSMMQLKMKNPDKIKLNSSIDINGKTVPYHYIDTGAPHVVIEADALDQELKNIDVHKLGAFIRYHKKFQPSGTNVNFVKKIGQHTIQIRTYERGVEAETLACGTGSIASAIISSFVMKTKSPVTVKVQSNAALKVDFRKEAEKVDNVRLTGPAKIVFTGTVNVSI